MIQDARLLLSIGHHGFTYSIGHNQRLWAINPFHDSPISKKFQFTHRTQLFGVGLITSHQVTIVQGFLLQEVGPSSANTNGGVKSLRTLKQIYWLCLIAPWYLMNLREGGTGWRKGWRPFYLKWTPVSGIHAYKQAPRQIWTIHPMGTQHFVSWVNNGDQTMLYSDVIMPDPRSWRHCCPGALSDGANVL